MRSFETQVLTQQENLGGWRSSESWSPKQKPSLHRGG